MPTNSYDADVAVIGAGPTGLMLASLLGQQGIATTVLERRSAPHTEPRAIAYDPETLRLFQTIGRYEALRPTLMLDVPVVYNNASGRILMEMTGCPPAFGHSGRGTYYQPELEAALAEGLQDSGNVSVQRGVTVGGVADLGGRVELALTDTRGDHSVLSARYAVACDGGASRTRSRLGIRFEGSTFSEKWLVVDTRGDDIPSEPIRFFCNPERPAVTLPVSRNRRRWEFLVMPGDDEAELATENRCRELMAEHGGGRASEIERALVYTFHARFAERFRDGRVLLAGDAAHVMPPFAGQGLNSGMRDAANLAWKLAAVCRGQMDEALLDSYEAERRKHVVDMTKLAIRLGKVIMPTNKGRALARDVVLGLLRKSARVRRALNEGSIIPKPSLDKSALVNWSAGGRVGEMIEQPLVSTRAGDVLLDDMLGPGFAVIGIDCDPRSELSPEDLETLAQLGAQLISVASRTRNESAAICDRDGELSAWLGLSPAVLVVRPDRFVIDAVKPARSARHFDWIATEYKLTGATTRAAHHGRAAA